VQPEARQNPPRILVRARDPVFDGRDKDAQCHVARSGNRHAFAHLLGAAAFTPRRQPPLRTPDLS
jgi:hypothetical protein